MEQKTKNKKGLPLMIAGLLFLAAAAGLVLYNRMEDERAGEASAEVLEKVEQATSHTQLQPLDDRMPVISVDGRDYIGVVRVESAGIALPVLSYWDEEDGKIAPGLYTGSAYTDNMVLCGHNYKAHFAPLHHVETGAEVRFTDINGNEFVYEVSEIYTLKSSEVLEMISGKEWDLTLFTCTTGGQARITLRCVRRSNR